MSHPCVAEAQDKEWLSRSDWQACHERLLRRKDKLRDTQLVFLGDSITEAWLTDGLSAWEECFTSYKPLNLGIGGDETSNVLWRIENGELDGISPKVLVLLIGTNNIGNSGHAGKDTAEGVKLIVEKIRVKLPVAKILLLAVLPRDKQRNTPFRKEVDDLNTRIRPLHDGKSVYYLDLASAFLGADGSLSKKLFPDSLHLSAKAYEILAEAMMPVLKTLMG